MDELLILVSLAKSGDEVAFSELLAKYQGLLLSMSKEYSNMCPELSRENEDFLQEAKIAFFNAIKTFDEEKKITFGAYAKTCIKNRLISCVRKMNSKKRRKKLESISDGHDTVPSATISKEEREFLLSLAQSSLSRFEYVIFEMYFSGLRTKEISTRINKSEKSVNNAIYRLKSKLSRLVNNDT